MNSEDKNTASVMLFKTTWHVEVSGHLDYFETSSIEAFYSFIMYFFTF